MLLDLSCQEFIAENHSVSCSNQPFAQVWPDMALEQSIDLETKKKRGTVGMSRKEDAVDRWFLTVHERAAMTHAPKEMCGLENCDRIGTHREAEATTVSRDEREGLQHLAFHQNSYTRVDLIFDQYRPVSIKARERSKRGESSSFEINIHGGSTPVPKQWSKFISNPVNLTHCSAVVEPNL